LIIKIKNKIFNAMKKIWLLGASLCVLASCNEKVIETPVETGGAGYLSLGINPDNYIAVKSDVAGEALDAYIVTVFNSDGSSAKAGKYGDVFKDKTIALEPDTYKIEAQNCTPEAALSAVGGKGQKHIYGSVGNVEITAGETVLRQVDCKVINTAVKATFDESFEHAFKSWTLGLSDNAATPRKFTIANLTSTDEYYWNVQDGGLTLSYSIEATSEDGKTAEKSGSISAEKGTLYTLKFTAGTHGHLQVTITAKDDMNQADETVLVDPYLPTPAGE